MHGNICVFAYTGKSIMNSLYYGKQESDDRLWNHPSMEPTKTVKLKISVATIANRRFWTIALRNRVFSIKMPALFFLLVLLSGCAAAPTIDPSLRAKAIEGDVRAQYEIGERFPIHFADRIAADGASKHDDGVLRPATTNRFVQCFSAFPPTPKRPHGCIR